MMPPVAKERDVLLDVSRLIWRVWEGRRPTGVDRVCLAYLQHFGPRSLAVIQRRGWRRVLSAWASDRLFRLLAESDGGHAPLLRWIGAGLASLPSVLAEPAAAPGMIYLNVGHTGLDDPTLPSWVAAHRLRPVYMVHDLIPITHPRFCRPGEADKHQRRMQSLLATAAGVICNSKATAEELSRYAAAQGLALPPTLSAHIAGGDLQRAETSSRAEEPYFLVLGTIEGRKNHALLLRVWDRLQAELGESAPRLVIVGQRGWMADPVFARLDKLGPLANLVEERGSCDDLELARLLGSARALLMPSFVEGFGLPIIEALQLGTPVIASDLGVYREIAGNIPAYLNPADDDQWLGTIRDFLVDSSRRERQIASMRSFQAPSWPDHFAQVEAWLAKLAPQKVSTNEEVAV